MHQVELAALDYQKTRLVRVMGKGGRLRFGQDGEAEVVSARGYYFLSVNHCQSREVSGCANNKRVQRVQTVYPEGC